MNHHLARFNFPFRGLILTTYINNGISKGMFQNILVFIMYLLAGTHAVPALRVSFMGMSTPYSILIFYILILITFIRITVDREMIKFPVKLFNAFLFYYFSIALSTCFAEEINWEVLIKWLFFPIMPFCISMIANRAVIIKYALVLFMISGLCVFVYGIYGFITWNVGEPSQHALGYFGVTYEESSRNGDMLYFQSTFWILLSISLVANNINKYIRYLCSFLAMLVASGLILGLARGAWISAIITVITATLMQRFLEKKHSVLQLKLLKTKLIFISLLVFSLMFVFISTADKEYFGLLSSRTDSITTFSEEGGNSNLARYMLLLKVSEIAASNPFGVGVWNLKYHLKDFYLSGLASAENIYFHMLAEQGFIGLVAYLFILIWTIKRLYRYIITNQQSSELWLGWCLMLILINWCAYGFFNIMIETLWYWLGISLAIALTTSVTPISVQANNTIPHSVSPNLSPHP